MRFLRREPLGFGMALTLPVAALLAVSACGDGRKMPDRERVAQHMEAHFERAGELRQAVVEDRLDKVAEPARWLAGHAAIPDLPSTWVPYLDSLREAAAAAADAKDIQAAAVATARVAASCGDCHVALGAKPGPDIEGRPPRRRRRRGSHAKARVGGGTAVGRSRRALGRLVADGRGGPGRGSAGARGAHTRRVDSSAGAGAGSTRPRSRSFRGIGRDAGREGADLRRAARDVRTMPLDAERDRALISLRPQEWRAAT